MLANQSNWNPASLINAFLHGLLDYIKDALVSHDLPPTLDGIIELAIRVDLGGRPLLRGGFQMEEVPNRLILQVDMRRDLSPCSSGGLPSHWRRGRVGGAPISVFTVEELDTIS